MKPEERLAFKLHTRTRGFQRRLTEARGYIEAGLAEGRGLVSCSWGKDSVVMLHLVQQIAPGARIVHVGDEHEDWIDNYGEVAAAYLDRFGGWENYVHISVPTGGIGSKAAIDGHAVARGCPVRFIGLRIEENGGRKWSLWKYGGVHQYQVGPDKGLWRVCPLLHWSWLDVWAYTVFCGLPYLSWYDSPHAGPKKASRTAPVFGRRLFEQRARTHTGAAHAGRFANVKAHSPRFWNYLLERWPWVGTMV